MAEAVTKSQLTMTTTTVWILFTLCAFQLTLAQDVSVASRVVITPFSNILPRAGIMLTRMTLREPLFLLFLRIPDSGQPRL